LALVSTLKIVEQSLSLLVSTNVWDFLIASQVGLSSME
jgi:hypothetical protein